MVNRRRDLLRGRQRKLFLAPLAALLCVALAGCNWELNVYRTLAEAQIGYQKYFTVVVQLHDAGAITDAGYERAKDITDRIATLGRSTTALLISYRNVKDAATKSKIDAAIAEIPALVADLVAISGAVGPPAPPSNTGGNGGPLGGAELEVRSRRLLECLSQKLAAVEALR